MSDQWTSTCPVCGHGFVALECEPEPVGVQAGMTIMGPGVITVRCPDDHEFRTVHSERTPSGYRFRNLVRA